MHKNVLRTVQAPEAIGPYSQGVRSGNLVFTSGQLPIDPATGTIAADIKTQARQALENVASVLEAGGSNLHGILKVTVFLTDMADFAAVNEVYAAFFEHAAPFPARSAVQVSALPKPEAKIEIEAIGVVAL
ncbi:Rid family detoxifying hydrolase [bacterium]|nr:Rid family detoxifying hydrolase [bacterium]